MTTGHERHATGPDGLRLRQNRGQRADLPLSGGAHRSAGLGAGLRCSCAETPQRGREQARRAGRWVVEMVPRAGQGADLTANSYEVPPRNTPRRKFTGKYFALRLLKIDPG